MIPLKVRHYPGRAAVAAVLLIAANSIIFIFQSVGGLEKTVSEYGLIPYFVTHPFTSEITVRQTVPVAIRWGRPIVGIREVPVYRPRPGPWGSLITSIFLHGDWFHLILNMLFLWVFGRSVEIRFGPFRFLFFYFLCGLGASLTHVLFHPSATVPMVGASGAVSGVMGAFFILYPYTRVVTLLPFFFFFHLVELPAFLFLGIWFLFQLLSIGSPSDVAFLAHVGGFIIGLALAPRFARRKPCRPPFTSREFH